MTNETNYKPCLYKCNGATKDFPFDFQVHKNDKTLKYSDLIVTLVNTGTQEETVLTENTNYTVLADTVGGNITTTTVYSTGYDIVISRKTSFFQGKSFATSAGFQASEVENAFDRVSCGLQDMDYNIETFKEEYSAETNQKIEDFENEVNSKIEQVTEAVNQLHRLDEVLETCERFAVVSEEQSIIAQNQAVLAEEHAQSAEQTLANIQNEHAVALDNLEATKANSINEIKATGIYMVSDRLFYKDKNGVAHEFRNDYGGIAPMAVKHKEVRKVENGNLLTWTDPDDSIYQNNVYCTWGNTLILRKEGSYPESPFDGEVVIDNKIRNQYAETGYLDEVDITKDYYYRAFPCSINKVYSFDNFNKFGLWIYSFTRLKKETIPSEKIVYRGMNEHYQKAYNDFNAGNQIKLCDWENAPFLLKDRLAPCAVGFDGELKYFLDVNDFTKKEDGTASNNSDPNTELNFFMRIKLLYRRKRKNANGDTEVDISNVKVNDEYKPYGGFIKPDGTLREYIYLPIYRGSLINGKCRSIAGQTPMNNQTAPNERLYCQANGAGHDMITHADRELREDIYMLLFKNTDSQTVLGAGKSNGGDNINACLKSGTMDTKGLFAGSSSTAEGVKFMGMENIYASQWERILGEVLVNGVRKVKLCQGTSDGSTVEDFNFTGEGYISLDELPKISGTSGGYISEEQTVDDIGTFPVVISGSSTTNECDGMWFNNSGTMVALRGGSSYDGAICGVFCSSLTDPASGAYWSFGSSVSYKPL